MAILLNIILAIYVVVALLMVFVILMQRPKSEGLGAAFGGGVTENIFGAQTTNVLTKITGWLAGIFFTLTFLLSILYAQRTNNASGLRQELMKDSPNAAMPAVSPGAANSANPAPGAGEGQAIVPAPPEGAPQNLPAVEGAGSPSAADMAVGAVQPVPAPATTPAEQAPAPSPAGSP
ncbi:MAG TPA: preprotein translocase subunit SecG [Chthoniobacterales bacterium]|nr:preprotein translocase subunit SecG [Chthoniobacterales bacterium]